MSNMNDVKWLMAREIPHLRRYARALVRDPSAADDLVQDCLERALSKRHLWRRRGSMRSWLLKILYNIFKNDLRRLRRRPILSSIETSPPIQATVTNQEQYMACRNIVEALKLLSDGQRSAIELLALEDVSYEEAAWILDIPVGTLRSRLSRGRELLRDFGWGVEKQPKIRRVR